MRLCINPYCHTSVWENPDTATHCENCGCELLVNELYTVKSLLSNKSGFGTVYELVDTTGKTRVLKVLKPIFNEEQRTVALFQQEVFLLQQIDSPTLPKIEAYIHHELPDGKILHGIIMEKIAGNNLHEWLKARENRPISQATAIAWLQELVRALDLIHQKNYFHRDIKPSNIMLEPSGRLVLIDFGSARHQSATYLSKLYGEGGITQITSAGYTAPEQERGFAMSRSDFYALGMTFIHLVTGKYPLDLYDPNSDTYHWREFAPQITPAFADLLDGLIAFQPIARPANCKDILHQLEHITTLTPSNPLSTPTPTLPIDRVGMGIAIAVVSSLAIAGAINYRLLSAPTRPSSPASFQPNCTPDKSGTLNCAAHRSTNI